MKRPVKIQQDIEANQFAMALLMPEKMLRNEISKLQEKKLLGRDCDEVVGILAKKFGVTKERMTIRLTQLQLIT